MLLHLSAITLTCFVTHELKSCQELVILPALNTDRSSASKCVSPKNAFCLFCTAGGTDWFLHISLTCQLVPVMAQGLPSCPRPQPPALPITWRRKEMLSLWLGVNASNRSDNFLLRSCYCGCLRHTLAFRKTVCHYFIWGFYLEKNQPLF